MKINNYFNVNNSSYDQSNLSHNNIITNNQNSIISNTVSKKVKTEKKRKKKKNTTPCRICFCTESDHVNPLISPCKCSGTMKYIHLLCLKQW